jgi:hypothetical protein
MEAVLDLLRFQLTCNIYPFHDARLRAAARPQLAAAAEEAEAAAGGAGTGKKRSAKKAKAAGAAGLRWVLPGSPAGPALLACGWLVASTCAENLLAQCCVLCRAGLRPCATAH